MIEVGRICVKLAGRDAGKKCVILDNIDKSFVTIDGETRRRKCNVTHLEPTNKTVKIAKNAAHKDVVKVFKDLGIELKEKKPRKPTTRDKTQKVVKNKSNGGSSSTKKEKSSAKKSKDNKSKK